MTTTAKIDEFIRRAMGSGQSEARAVAECLEDAMDGCDGDEHASMASAMAAEFIGWGDALRQLADGEAGPADRVHPEEPDDEMEGDRFQAEQPTNQDTTLNIAAGTLFCGVWDNTRFADMAAVEITPIAVYRVAQLVLAGWTFRGFTADKGPAVIEIERGSEICSINAAGELQVRLRSNPFNTLDSRVRR